jgi:hypothetical protein
MQRYATFEKPLGQKVANGEATLTEMAEYAASIGEVRCRQRLSWPVLLPMLFWLMYIPPLRSTGPHSFRQTRALRDHPHRVLLTFSTLVVVLDEERKIHARVQPMTQTLLSNYFSSTYIPARTTSSNSAGMFP